MKEQNNAFLVTKPVGALMRGYALPCVLSLLTGALYNIVDQLFIANASYLGSAGNAANTVVFPLTVIALGIAVMLGDGCCAFFSLSLGGGEKAKAKRSVGNAVGLCLGLSFVLTAVYLICADPILALFGAGVNARVLSLSREYFFWITLGIPFYMFGQAMNPIIRADGSPRFAMCSTLAGAFLNVILDPIFIFGYFGVPRMGVAGAAIATVIGQIVAGTAACIINLKANTEIHLRIKGFRPDGKIIGLIYEVGIPSIIMQSIGSVMTYGMNKILLGFSSTAAAVFGVYFKLQSFIFMPVFGLNNGMVPIIAYNYGAGKRERLIKTLKLSILYAVILMLIGFLVFQVMPDSLLGLFDASETMLAIGRPALRIISISFLLAGFSIVCGSMFQALGNGVYSMLVSIARQLIVLLPVAYLLSRTGNIDMVWWAFPIAELVSGGLTIFFLVRIYRNVIVHISEPEHETAQDSQSIQSVSL